MPQSPQETLTKALRRAENALQPHELAGLLRPALIGAIRSSHEEMHPQLALLLKDLLPLFPQDVPAPRPVQEVVEQLAAAAHISNGHNTGETALGEDPLVVEADGWARNLRNHAGGFLKGVLNRDMTFDSDSAAGIALPQAYKTGDDRYEFGGLFGFTDNPDGHARAADILGRELEETANAIGIVDIDRDYLVREQLQVPSDDDGPPTEYSVISMIGFVDAGQLPNRHADQARTSLMQLTLVMDQDWGDAFWERASVDHTFPSRVLFALYPNMQGVPWIETKRISLIDTTSMNTDNPLTPARLLEYQRLVPGYSTPHVPDSVAR